MFSFSLCDDTFFVKALALALGVLGLGDSTVCADDTVIGTAVPPQPHSHKITQQKPRVMAGGSLGYAPPGFYPGFSGFGLGYHRGYGYGGAGLGVSAEGGYPFYGGPGYPHPGPCLQRLGGINPFPYYAGSGYPTPEEPHYYASTPPLASDQPIVTVGYGPPDTHSYGAATGTIPYSEAYFAPFTARAAVGDFSTPSFTTNAPRPDANNGASLMDDSAGSSIGIEVEVVTGDENVKGLKILDIKPSSAAEKGGLHIGDVISIINGYQTLKPDNLTWIINNVTKDKVLNMSVRGPNDDKDHKVRVQLP